MTGNPPDACFGLTTDSAFLTKWGSRGVGSGECDGPHFVMVDADRHVCVTDWVNSRIQKFAPAAN